jgi:hypothetical protein
MCGDTLSSDPIKRVTYNIAVAIFAYIAPLITIFFSYFRILYVLQKRCDRRGFRLAKAHGRSVQSCDKHPSSELLNANGAKGSHQERRRSGQAPVGGEINTHNMKTVTRAKLKTLKLTALIGKNNLIGKRDDDTVVIVDTLVVCFILCWTPYYCIVFFLLITDPSTSPEERSSPHWNVTLTTPLDTNISHEPSRDERSLLILLMLAVSNSLLDPMIYGRYRHVCPSLTTLLSRSIRLLLDETYEIKLLESHASPNGKSHIPTCHGSGGCCFACWHLVW